MIRTRLLRNISKISEKAASHGTIRRMVNLGSDIKEETGTIVALIEAEITRTKLRGPGQGRRRMIGLCSDPWRQEPVPLVVNRSKNVWNCVGACGCGGDVFSGSCTLKRLSFRHCCRTAQ